MYYDFTMFVHLDWCSLGIYGYMGALFSDLRTQLFTQLNLATLSSILSKLLCGH